MNPLPYDNQQWALARIVTAPAFQLGAGPWTVQPMWNKRRNGFGFELLTCTRVALPAIGEATFQYHFGMINHQQIGVQDAAGVARRIAGTDWDPANDAATAPDLSGYEVRIQLAPAVLPGATPAWRTVWWGQVEYQEDQMWPGAAFPSGTRTYRCVDGFARAKRWPLNRHSTTYSPDYFMDVEGHPGYNVGIDGRIIGNRDADILSTTNAALSQNPAIIELAKIGDTAYCLHAHQGSMAVLTFTVLQALEDAMRKTRGFGEPVFSFSGIHANDLLLLGDVVAIPVRDGDTAWDLVVRMCRRERGRGMVFVDWSDDVANPTGTLTVKLTVRPQTYDDISYTAPAAGGSPTPLVGAASTTGGRTPTTVAVDVIGDHRLIAEGTQLSDKFLHVADAVETTSELIQVLVTLSYYDGTDLSISQRWTAGRQATFNALAAKKRVDDAWEPMWQLHGLPPGWTGQAKNHNGATSYYCDFACNDAGVLVNSGTATANSPARNITSPLLCRILPDLPLYEGYDHTNATPKRKIGDQVTFDENGQPARRPPLVLIRTAADRYLTGDEIDGGRRSVTVHVRGRDILIAAGSEKSKGTRVIGDTTVTNLHSRYNLSQLGITVGIELPHRIRRKSYRTDPATNQAVQTVRRVLSVRLPDLHLWLAHSGAIWDLDTTTRNSSGCSSLTNAANAVAETPGLIRDDRDRLSRLHAMACAWYLQPRQTGKWTLRACGMLPSFETLGTSSPSDHATPPNATVTYPTMGYVVTDFKASGQITTFNTPITMIHYDHQAGRTTWETDWQELDFV